MNTTPKSDKERLLTDWIAIIYNNHLEVPSSRNLLESPVVGRPPVSRFLQIPPVPIPSSGKGANMLYEEARTVLLRPGTNMPIAFADWQAILDADRVKATRGETPAVTLLLERKILKCVVPEILDELTSGTQLKPGYRNFVVNDAVLLVKNTTHEDWLEEMLAGETRAEVLEAARQQRQLIVSAKQRLAV